jgi:hypothetical protein
MIILKNESDSVIQIEVQKFPEFPTGYCIVDACKHPFHFFYFWVLGLSVSAETSNINTVVNQNKHPFHVIFAELTQKHWIFRNLLRKMFKNRSAKFNFPNQGSASIILA